MSTQEVHSRRKRKKVVLENPNPLFEKWITEWRDEAESKGWKTKFVYQKALKSLRNYPLKFKTGKEAKILENFGDKICNMLDDKLKEHRELHDLSEDSEEEVGQLSQSLLSNSQTNSSPTKTKKVKTKNTPTKSRTYIPTPGTGPFAILVTLYTAEEQEDKHFMKKAELQAAAQPLCDTSFTVPQAGSHYTAWSSMSTLITKGLLLKDGNPARYSLSNLGKELAYKLAFSTNNVISTTKSTNDILIPSTSGSRKHGHLPVTLSSSSSESSLIDINIATSSSISQTQKALNKHSSSTTSSQLTYTSVSPIKSTQSSYYGSPAINLGDDEEPTKTHIPQFTLKPGEFSVILCVDNCETQGGSKGSSKTNIISELQKNGVQFEIRKLHVGDFLWVAKQHVIPIPGQLRTPEPIELVFDYVIERKRMDDLAHSIKDGRYKEQKFRLKRSGVRCPSYLIEGYGTSKYDHGLPEKTLKQACCNTQINDGFMVKFTKDQKDSVAYLTLMTRHLQKMFSAKTLFSCTKDEISQLGLCKPNSFLTFNQFNTESKKRKKFVVKELFVLQLMKLKGMSKDKAIAITKVYETPLRLIKAYRSCQTSIEKEKMLSLIKVPPTNRNFGPALSKTISQLYCFEKLT